ncbi:hypothetical protein C0Q70_04154 [Pomacea canaliculata]|uniref:Acyltransferase 3 domain-containing protein n=2 Tax=Pomacea canaliculata TaxID=400727 RepID=A0A2T7PUR9_POMCA|nr:hypothetical protein C0Q70_04154 [Pomacea canaliculata]
MVDSTGLQVLIIRSSRVQGWRGGSLAGEVLLCFSFLRNLRRLLCEGSADMLFTLNGVRVMSIFWIVLGNTISLLNKTSSVMANNVDTVKIAQSFWMQAIINSTFAADSFFVLSGCLVAYHFLHSKTHKLLKTNGKRVFSLRGLVLFYFHRLMRLLPCFYVAIVLYTVLLPYMGQGPRWKGTDKGLQQCQDHWWANAFFFSNFYKADDMCMPWTYYLVNDFQFYLLSPLVLYPLLLKPLLGGFLIVLLVAIQIVSTCLLMNNINGNMLNMEEGYFDEVYVKPYCRVGAFAVGMALGYFLHSTEHRVYFRKLPLFLGWTLSLCTIGTVVYVTHTENQPDGQRWTRLQSAVYEALSRPAWAMSVSWIIFTSTVGQGGFINSFLSWSPFVAMCRLTYGVYLLHPILITVVLNSSRFPIYLHFGSLIYMYVANLVCSYGIGFLLIALVECPFTKLDILMRVKLKKKST